MGWASQYIEKLKNNETVSFRPRGHSMKGKIDSGQLCTVAPIQDEAELKKQVTEQLKQQKTNEKVRTWLADLQKEANVTYFVQY